VETEQNPLRQQLREQTARIKQTYQRLSDSYQSGKGENDIPLN